MKVLRANAFLGVLAAAALSSGCGMQTAAIDHEGRPLQSDVTAIDRSATANEGAASLKMFVANRSSNAVTVYADAANGDVKPLFKIRGSNTRLNAPVSLAFDGARLLYVLSASSFAVFAPGVHGNVAPKYDVGGGLSQISNPQGLAVDPTGKTYVTNYAGQSYITAYAPGSDGDRAPVQTIYDGQSFLFVPSGIAVHANTLYVGDLGDQTINEYSATANGIVNPTAVISGLNMPKGVAIDAQGRIYVTDSDAIIVYAADANGHATPLRVISGSNTLMNGAMGLTVHNSEISVANAGNNSITVYPETGNGNISPLRQISGASTGLSGPQGVAVH